MLFRALIYTHIACVVLTITLLIVRYWWRYTGNPREQVGWARR